MHLTLSVCPSSSSLPSRQALLTTTATAQIGSNPQEPYHAVLNPSQSDTLALWRVAGEPVAWSIAAALYPIAQRPGGTAHIGYRRHQANVGKLILAGRLVACGQTLQGKPIYRIWEVGDHVGHMDHAASASAPASNFATAPANSNNSDGVAKPAEAAKPVPSAPATGALAHGAAGRSQSNRALLMTYVTTQQHTICSQCCGETDLRENAKRGVTVRKCRRCAWEDTLCVLVEDDVK